MRTDGLFTVREYTISCKRNQSIRLIPFGDIHFDSPAFCHDTWQEFLERTKEVKDTYYLGMGDYLDSYSTSERGIIYDGNLHESTRKRQEADDRLRVTTLANQLKHLKGRVIGLMGGNHFQQYTDGSTSDMLLANKLGCPYLGACCALRIKLKWDGATKGNHSHSTSFDIFAHHGKGGGTTAGGRFNSVEKMAAVCDAEIYLMGDNHARGVFPLGDMLYLDHCSTGIKLRARKRWIGRTGSFLRGYEPGEVSYVVDRCLPPANLGWIEFVIKLSRKEHINKELISIDITATQ